MRAANRSRRGPSRAPAPSSALSRSGPRSKRLSMRRLRHELLLPIFALVTAACGAEVVQPPTTPQQPGPTVPAPIVAPPVAGPEALEIQGTVREETLPLLKAPVLDPAKAQLPAAPAGL